jgi:hypothetical protein
VVIERGEDRPEDGDAERGRQLLGRLKDTGRDPTSSIVTLSRTNPKSWAKLVPAPSGRLRLLIVLSRSVSHARRARPRRLKC